jgi:long-chain acyl-CoA synthetase
MTTSAIAESFERTCRERSAAAAIYWLADERAITFGELYEQYERIRQIFRVQGVTAGACVISLVGNHPIFFPLLAACMGAGAALLPLGEATDAEALAMIDNARASALVTGRALPIPGAFATAIDAGVSVIRLPAPGDAPSYGTSRVIKLTSGSTDLPKAALAGELALLDDARSIAAGMGITGDDVTLGLLPLSHAYALGHLAVPLILQGTRVALRPAFAPGQFLRDVRSTGATVFPGVPYMFDRLRTVLEGETLPRTLRLLVTAGARIDRDTVAWFHRHAARKIHSFYGTSETGGITFDETDELADALHVGRPLPGVTVEILPERGADGDGRIFVRSGGLAVGYAPAAPAETQAAFQDGGFRTSDLGHFNADGQLVLTGRVSPLVNVAGRKVDPAEVERVLARLPDVVDARVVGVACATRGQELVAFVVRSGGSLSPLQLRRSCADTLSPYKIPRRFIFLEQWPVDARGKVDRRALETLAEGAE